MRREASPSCPVCKTTCEVPKRGSEWCRAKRRQMDFCYRQRVDLNYHRETRPVDFEYAGSLRNYNKIVSSRRA